MNRTIICQSNHRNIHTLLSQPFSPAVKYSLRKLSQENINRYGTCNTEDMLPLNIESQYTPEVKRLLHRHNKNIINSLLQQHFSEEATEALEYMKAENDQIYKYDNALTQLDRETYSGPEQVWSYYDPVHQPNQQARPSVIGSNRPVAAVSNSGQYSLFGRKRHSRRKSRSHRKSRSRRCRCNK